MKYFDFDSEEMSILRDFEDGNLVADKDSIGKLGVYKQYATQTLSKTRNINIRLPEKTLWKLKARAVQNNIPYQTLISSILHRFTQSKNDFSF